MDEFSQPALTTKEAAKFLQISVVSLRRLVNAGIIVPYRPLGARLWFFDRRVLVEYRKHPCGRGRTSLPKRRQITKDYADSAISDGVWMFQKRFGLGMTLVWDALLAYSEPRSGKIDVPFQVIIEDCLIDREYLTKCLEYFARWRWIQPGFSFGNFKLSACLMDRDGKVPVGGVPEYTIEEMADTVDDDCETESESDADEGEKDTESTANEGEPGLAPESQPVLQAPPREIEIFSEPFVASPEYQKLAVLTQKDAVAVKHQKNEVPPEVWEVFEYWKLAVVNAHKRFFPTKQTRAPRVTNINGDVERKIRRALAEYGKERVLHMIDGCLIRKYNVVHGYVGLDLILRDNSKCEQYERFYDLAFVVMNADGTVDRYEAGSDEAKAAHTRLQKIEAEKEAKRLLGHMMPNGNKPKTPGIGSPEWMEMMRKRIAAEDAANGRG